MFKFVRIAALLMLAVVVAACSGESAPGGSTGGTPEDTAKSFMTAFADGDAAKIADLLCESQKDSAELLANTFSGSEMAELEVKIDVSGLNYTAANVTDTSATVNVSGDIKVSVMGQESTQSVTDMFGEGIPMTKENGAWKMCQPAA